MDVVTEQELIAGAESCAAALVRNALAGSTFAERRRAARLGRILSDPIGRELMFTLADEVLRTGDEARAARRLRSLVAAGAPRSLGLVDRVGLRLAAAGGRVAPAVVGRAVRARVRADARGVIASAADPAFSARMARRAREGIECNVNALGEMILGDDEADARLENVCRLLCRPDVRCVSVKLSALCANLDVLAFDHAVGRSVERLQRILRVAAAAR